MAVNKWTEDQRARLKYWLRQRAPDCPNCTAGMSSRYVNRHGVEIPISSPDDELASYLAALVLCKRCGLMQLYSPDITGLGDTLATEE